MVLAIDYGTKRIGLALSDETETIAQAIEPIIVKNNRTAFIRIHELITLHKLTKILLGLPLGYDEKPTQISIEVEKFAKKVAEKFNIETAFWNETLTSKMAGVKIKDKRNGKLDSESARILLQEYLNFQKDRI